MRKKVTLYTHITALTNEDFKIEMWKKAPLGYRVTHYAVVTFGPYIVEYSAIMEMDEWIDDDAN